MLHWVRSPSTGNSRSTPETSRSSHNCSGPEQSMSQSERIGSLMHQNHFRVDGSRSSPTDPHARHNGCEIIELLNIPSPCVNKRGTDSCATTRLPGYDAGTHRSELALFCGLGFAALALIGFTVFSAARFVLNREAIIAALSSEPAIARVQNIGPANTNIAVLAPPPLPVQTTIPAGIVVPDPCCPVQSL
jgi:hypothetical protein